MKTYLVPFLLITVLLSGCSSKDATPDYTVPMVGTYTAILGTYDNDAKKKLSNYLKINISRVDKNVLNLAISSNAEYWNTTRKAVDVIYSNTSLVSVKATAANNLTVDESASYFTSNSTNSKMIHYTGKGSFSTQTFGSITNNNFTLLLNSESGSGIETMNFELTKEK